MKAQNMAHEIKIQNMAHEKKIKENVDEKVSDYGQEDATITHCIPTRGGSRISGKLKGGSYV